MARKNNEEEKTVTKYAELRGVPTVTTSEAIEHGVMHVMANQMQALVFVGEAGIGKSRILDEIGRRTGHGVHRIFSAQYGMVGTGIPQKADDGFFDIAVPSTFPRREDKTIFTFEEWNRGLQHTIAQMFSLMEDRKQFNYELPYDCAVFATMNPSLGDYAVTAIERDPAMRRRMKFLYVIPDFKGWVQHASTGQFHSRSRGPAKDKACHPAIMAYVKANPKSLYDSKARDAGQQFACPASWEMISESAYAIEAVTKKTLFGDFAQSSYGGTIGTPLATQLCAYIKDSSASIGADDVLYHYATVRDKICKLTTKGDLEKLTDIGTNVIQLLFADSPKVADAAVNFLPFVKDLPKDLADALCVGLRDVAQQNDSMQYLQELVLEFQEHDAWLEIQMGLDSNHKSIADALKPKEQ